jgi:hypothetical protein
MPDTDDDELLPELLGATLSRLAEHNHPERQAYRKRFALDHTYGRQIERVAQFLASTTHTAPAQKRSGPAESPHNDAIATPPSELSNGSGR